MEVYSENFSVTKIKNAVLATTPRYKFDRLIVLKSRWVEKNCYGRVYLLMM
jgi:hypothetical protein